jgi:thiol:disulfide interchange protein DsbA
MSRLRILAALLCVLAAPAYAQVQGQDYELLNPPQATAAADKVEVIEFFSYGCPHCYALQPHVVKWAAELPANATFLRVPVSFGRREWGMLSRAYYTLEATGDLARLDDALFEGIHKEQKPLFNEDQLAAVSAKAMRAEQLSRDYKVNGVPSLIVDGKYIAKGRTHEDMLKIARQLVDKASAERKTAQR